MITVIVEHFLCAEGQKYIPQWIKETDELLRTYGGYISTVQLKDINQPERTVLLLKFENLDLLKVWGSSTDHEKSIDKLKSFSKKVLHSQIFTEQFV